MKVLKKLKYLGLFLGAIVGSNGCFGGGDPLPGGDQNLTLSDKQLCKALDVSGPQAYMDAGNTAHFEQLNSDQPVFIFVSPQASAAYDGLNVIELTSAQVQFDFEDASVDPGNFGGFYARWKIVWVPFDQGFADQLANATNLVNQTQALNSFLGASNRVEAQLGGPFLQNGCEWGDTSQLGTQNLTYSNYGVYDWDFFPGVNRVLGIIWEGDEGVGDDFIVGLDITMGNTPVAVQQAGKFDIQFNALSNVAVGP